MQSKRKITVLLDEEEFQRFQEFCTDMGHKKSTLIARLIREHLDQQSQLPTAGVPAGEKSPAETGGRQ